MFLIRVALPDRPGTLGAVASAMGTVGADIQAVEIVGRHEDGRVVDDFMVSLPESVMPDNAVSACTQLEGVSVLWCARYPAGTGLELDVEVLERMLAEPAHAAEVLCQSAPGMFHSHWSVLVNKVNRSVIHATPMAPDLTSEVLADLGPFDFTRTLELDKGWVPEWVETTLAVTPVRGNRALLLGRHGGPAFLAAEVARLRYLATLVPVV
ncbi:ACT domain-containing protein [Mariniluteicoccus flavus]